MKSGTKLKLFWDPWGNPRFYGFRRERRDEAEKTTHIEWFVTDGHWLAEHRFVKGGSALRVLCSSHGRDWIYNGSQVAEMSTKTRESIEALLVVPENAVSVKSCGVSETSQESGLDISTPWEAETVLSFRTSMPVEGEGILKLFNVSLIAPFLACDEWKSTPDPTTPLWILNEGRCVAAVMPIKPDHPEAWKALADAYRRIMPESPEPPEAA